MAADIVPGRLALATDEQLASLNGFPVSAELTDVLKRAESLLLLPTVKRCRREIDGALLVAGVGGGHNGRTIAYAASLACYAWPKLHHDEIRELTWRWDAAMSDRIGLLCGRCRDRALARMYELEQSGATAA